VPPPPAGSLGGEEGELLGSPGETAKGEVGAALGGGRGAERGPGPSRRRLFSWAAAAERTEGVASGPSRRRALQGGASSALAGVDGEQGRTCARRPTREAPPRLEWAGQSLGLLVLVLVLLLALRAAADCHDMQAPMAAVSLSRG